MIIGSAEIELRPEVSEFGLRAEPKLLAAADAEGKQVGRVGGRAATRAFNAEYPDLSDQATVDRTRREAEHLGDVIRSEVQDQIDAHPVQVQINTAGLAIALPVELAPDVGDDLAGRLGEVSASAGSSAGRDAGEKFADEFAEKVRAGLGDLPEIPAPKIPEPDIPAPSKRSTDRLAAEITETVDRAFSFRDQRNRTDDLIAALNAQTAAAAGSADDAGAALGGRFRHGFETGFNGGASGGGGGGGRSGGGLFGNFGDDADDEGEQSEKALHRVAQALRDLETVGGHVGAALGKTLAPIKALGGATAGVGAVGVGTAAVGGLTAFAGAAGQAVTAGLALPGVLAGVGLAFGAVKVGLAGTDDALEAIGGAFAGDAGAAEDFGKSLTKLGPQTQKTAKTLFGMRGEVNALRLSVQDDLFGPLNAGLGKAGDTILPVVGTALREVSTELGHTGADILDFLTKGQGLAQVKTLFGDLPEVVAPLGGVLEAATRTGLDVFTASAKLLPEVTGDIGQGITGLLGKVDAFANSPKFEASFHRGYEAAKELFGGITDIAGGIGDILSAAAPLGGVLLGKFSLLGAGFREFTSSDAGQAKLTDFFERLEPVLGSVADLGGEVLDALGPIIPAALQVAEVLVDGLAGGIKALEPGLLAIAQIAEEVAPALGDVLASAGADLADVLEHLADPEIIGPLTQALKEFVENGLEGLVQVADALIPALPPLAQAFADVVAAFVDGDELGQVAGAFADALIAVAPFAGPLAEGVAELVVALLPLIPALTDLTVSLMPVFLHIIDGLLVVLPPVVAVVIALTSALSASAQGWDTAISLGNAYFDRLNRVNLDVPIGELIRLGVQSGLTGDDITASGRRGFAGFVNAARDAAAGSIAQMEQARRIIGGLFGGDLGAAAGKEFVASFGRQLDALGNLHVPTISVNAKVVPQLNGQRVPGYAAGGIVDRPTLLVAGERNRTEVILPLEDPARMLELLLDPRVQSALFRSIGTGTGPVAFHYGTADPIAAFNTPGNDPKPLPVDVFVPRSFAEVGDAAADPGLGPDGFYTGPKAVWHNRIYRGSNGLYMSGRRVGEVVGRNIVAGASEIELASYYS